MNQAGAESGKLKQWSSPGVLLPLSALCLAGHKAAQLLCVPLLAVRNQGVPACYTHLALAIHPWS